MPDRKIEIDILANEKGFTKGVGAASKSASNLEGALTKLGPVGKVVQGVIDKIGLSSLATATGIAGVLTGAVTGLVGILAASVGKYIQLGDEVENFRRVSGASAEDSSRLVAVFKELGVGVDTAAMALFKLGHGGGTGDVIDRLYQVADAWKAAGTASEKDQVVFKAFGKNGREMIPVLEQGSEGLRRLAAAGHLVFTEEDLQRVKRMEIHARQAKSAFDELMASIGRPVSEALDNLAVGVTAASYASDKYAKGLENGTIKARLYGPALGKLLDSFEAEYYASQSLSEALQVQSDAEKRAAENAQKLADELNAAVDADEKLASGSLAVARANLNVSSSQIRVTEAESAYNDAVKAHGANSVEAQKALIDYRNSILDQRQAYIDAGKAVRQHVMDQEADVDAQKRAKDATTAEIGSLQAMADKLAPNSPLRKFLTDYIAQLRNDIPTTLETTLRIRSEGGARPGGHGVLSFDEGGVVPGPRGAAVPAIVHGGETVIPAGGRAGGNVFNIHIHDGFYSDGPGIDRFANALAQRLTSVTGR